MPVSPAMQKSLSTGALRAAAEMKLTHIPKRATQHGTFMPGYEVLPAQLKPGQVKVERHVYGEEAKTHPETYLGEDLPARSTHHRSINTTTAPEDYLNPTRPMRPGEPKEAGGHHNVAHWRSTSHSAFHRGALEGARAHRQHGPSYQALNPPTCVGQGVDRSSYSHEYGLYGSDPRDKLAPHMTSMPVMRSVLTYGTPKGTNHMAGYQGFLPLNTANPKVGAYEAGHNLRSTDKSNLTEQFHANIVGYSAHVPKNPNNDRGGVKPNGITEFSRSFKAPPTGMI